MSDSPIESTKGLHESKERKPELTEAEKLRAITTRMEDYFFNEDRAGDDEEDATQFADDIATLLSIIGASSFMPVGPPRGEAETPTTPTDYAVAVLDRAIQIAVAAHAYQRDRQGLPVILHCLRVMFLTEDYLERSVAILHDTLEDTSLTAEKLRAEGMPNRVVGAVVDLTRTKDETYGAYINRVALSPLATRVKILDLTDNINRLPQLPLSEQTSLGERYAKAWKVLTRESANAD